MIVAHISASDISGGAAKAAYRLHQGLARAGVDSRMIVAAKYSHDDAVSSATSARTLQDRLRRRVRSEIVNRAFARYHDTKSQHLEFFSDDRAAEPKIVLDSLPGADIYHLHWVAGFVDYRAFLKRISGQAPVVWTLHDQNPLTGGCHYTNGCDNFTESCGKCPALGSSDSRDLSAKIFGRKQDAYTRMRSCDVRIVAPSLWMAQQASRSALLQRFAISRIPYGLDTEIFQPRSKTAAREVFGIPVGLPVVMFAAQSIDNYRKGMDLLFAALNEWNMTTKIGLLAVGSGRHAAAVPPLPYFHVGTIEDERLLSFAYSAADVFVSPAREENFAQVILEAMACGTPVAAFEVGGIPDMVRPGNTGLLAPRGDVHALRIALEEILRDSERRAEMSRECRRVAVAEYRLELQAERYARLYDDLLTHRTSPPGNGKQ